MEWEIRITEGSIAQGPCADLELQAIMDKSVKLSTSFLQIIIKVLMSFFQKEEKTENLQYDDTAFMHFSIAICAFTGLVMICVIWNEAGTKRLQLARQIKGMPIFREKIANQMKNHKSYFMTWAFWCKLLAIICCGAALAVCYSRIDQSQQMIGFDPHEILGVPTDAPTNTIKKAYRNLALIFHPDRNQHDPNAAAKFIQISKAYECLTDQKKKEVCLKYGNPDGQASYKVGIGLPAFMVETSNQTFVLPIAFLLLLVVIPKCFLSWSSQLKPIDEKGTMLRNFQSLYRFMGPNFKLISCPIMLGTMAELDPHYQGQQVLQPSEQAGFRNQLIQMGVLSPEHSDAIPPHILFRCYQVYFYMTANKKIGSSQRLLPKLCNQMIMFAILFAKKTGRLHYLANNPEWPIVWCGAKPVRQMIFFMKQMFFPGVILGQIQSIEFLDLTQEELQIAAQNPIGSSLTKFLHSDERIDEFVQKFPEARRHYIKQQILCLPAVSVEARVQIDGKEVKQITVDDVANFKITLTKKRSTPGYIMSKYHSYLTEQIFFLMLIYNDNVMHFEPVVFYEGCNNELIFNFSHWQSVERQMKIKLELLAPYHKMNLETQLELNVTGSVKNEMESQTIHEEDKNLEILPKTFWESIASLDPGSQSDLELSDGEDSDEDEQHRPQFEEST